MGLWGMLDGQQDFEVVGEAQNGEEAMEMTQRLNPDVVLMDLRMPDLDGVAATARIRERHPQARVLVLTTSDSGADILDRKSTRLNSSHANISYAVFCLKKTKTSIQ